MAKTKKLGAVVPEQSANDVLETAEMVRAANALLRTSEGIIFLCNSICSAEVVTKQQLESAQKGFNEILTLYGHVYAALMARYSALLDAEQVKKSREEALS